VFRNKKVVAIIPARGGSKGVPHKNIVRIGEKPLIAYAIEEACKSEYIDRVIVSTDDEKIAAIAKKYGAEVPFLRPKSLAKDTSSSLSVVLHAISYLEKKENYSPDIIVFLQPTSPFRRVEHIDAAIRKIEGADAVAGITEVKDHPYFMVKKKNGFLEPFIKIKNRPLRRQDVPKIYVFNASIYVAKRDYYKNVKETDPVAPVFDGKAKGVVMDEISSIDINTPLDVLLANAVVKRRAKLERN
jgi:CMP-N-acetylneuraminic acid synthetase